MSTGSCANTLILALQEFNKISLTLISPSFQTFGIAALFEKGETVNS